MAWLNDVQNLHGWLKSAPGDKDRMVHARLVWLASTALGYYAEGFLKLLANDSIEGTLRRYETKDRWDGHPNDIIFDNYPFDPDKADDIGMTINPSTGVVKVHNQTYAQPESVAGYNLVIATSSPNQFVVVTQLTVAMSGTEVSIPK